MAFPYYILELQRSMFKVFTITRSDWTYLGSTEIYHLYLTSDCYLD